MAAPARGEQFAVAAPQPEVIADARPPAVVEVYEVFLQRVAHPLLVLLLQRQQEVINGLFKGFRPLFRPRFRHRLSLQRFPLFYDWPSAALAPKMDASLPHHSVEARMDRRSFLAGSAAGLSALSLA